MCPPRDQAAVIVRTLASTLAACTQAEKVMPLFGMVSTRQAASRHWPTLHNVLCDNLFHWLSGGSSVCSSASVAKTCELVSVPICMWPDTISRALRPIRSVWLRALVLPRGQQNEGGWDVLFFTQRPVWLEAGMQTR